MSFFSSAICLKNPLVSVKTFVELFPEKYQDIEFRETFGRVVGQEIDRIDSLVSQLLHLTRTSSPHLEQIAPAEMVDAALVLTSTQCERQGITVERHYDPDLPDFLGDPPQLRKALLNIVLNAIAAMAVSSGSAVRERQRPVRPALPKTRGEVLLRSTYGNRPQRHGDDR